MCNSCVWCALHQWTNVPGTFSDSSAHWHANISDHTLAALKGKLHTGCSLAVWEVCTVSPAVPMRGWQAANWGSPSNARGSYYDWDDLVQLPRNILYNCVVYWCTYSLWFHQPISVFNQKIVQEERKLWSTCGLIPCSKQSHFLDLEQWASSLLHPTTETLGWRNLLGKSVPVLGHSLLTSLSK